MQPDGSIIDLLSRGCSAIGVDADLAQIKALSAYGHEVLNWGRRMNLTGATDANAFATGHTLDSLAALPHLQLADGQHWADVGSGAGTPGIPLAIVARHVRWTLVEPREKRWAFLLHAVHTLGLDNVTVLRARIEQANMPPATLDGVISRALGSPTLAAHPWLKPGGMVVLYAGAELNRWGDAASALPLEARQTVTLSVPGVTAPRHLVRFVKTGSG